MAREREGPAVERVDFFGRGAGRTGERDKRPPRARAHRGDVGDVDRNRLPTDVRGVGVAPPEMDVLDEEIGGGDQPRARGRLQHSAVVADAYEHAVSIRGGGAPDPSD